MLTSRIPVHMSSDAVPFLRCTMCKQFSWQHFLLKITPTFLVRVSQDPSRCFVNLYKLYNSKCPQNRLVNALYLSPLGNQREMPGTSKSLLSRNALSKTIEKMWSSFATLGLLEMMVTDNGPAFTSTEFSLSWKFWSGKKICSRWPKFQENWSASP